MPSISFDRAMTTGHGPYPPTSINASQSVVYVSGKPALINGDKADYHGHPNVGVCIASTSKVFIQGVPVVQIGDMLTDGDTVAQGSPTVFIK